jgi:hypothetical protein
MKNLLQVSCLILKPNQLLASYYSLTFPVDLKQVLLADYSRDRRRKNNHPISLPGHQFKALINASIPQVVCVDGRFPTDKPFLFCLEEVPEKRIKYLLKHWVRETYTLTKNPRKPKVIEQDITASLAAIQQASFRLQKHQLSPDDWELSVNGTAKPKNLDLFEIIPSIVVSKIVESHLNFPEFISQFKTIKFLPALETASSLFQKPQFCLTDVFYSKKGKPYSFMIHPRLLQIPGQPYAYLPLDFGVRRYLSKPYPLNYLPEAFSVMIYTPNGVCTAKITKERRWENNFTELLSNFSYGSIPNADELLNNPLGWSTPDLKLRFFVVNREGREKFQDVTAGVTPNDLVHLFNTIAPVLSPGFECFEPEIVSTKLPRFSKCLSSPCPDPIYYVDFQNIGKTLEAEAEILNLTLIKETDPSLVAMCNPIPVSLKNKKEQQIQERNQIIAERVKTLPDRYDQPKALILPIYPKDFFKKIPQEDPYHPLEVYLPERNLLIKRLSVPTNEEEVNNLSHRCKATLLALKCRLGYHDGQICEALKAYELPPDLQTIGIYLHKLSNGNYLPVAVKLDEKGILTGCTAISSWKPLREFIPYVQAATNIEGCKDSRLRKLTSNFFRTLTDSNLSTLILLYSNNTRQALHGLRDSEFGANGTISLSNQKDELKPFKLPENCRVIRCRDGGELPQATLWDIEKNRPARGRAIAKLNNNSYCLIRPKADTDQSNSQESMLRAYHNKSKKLIPPTTKTTAKKINLVEANPLLQPGDETLHWLAYLQYLQRIAPQYNNFLQLPMVLHIPSAFL